MLRTCHLIFLLTACVAVGSVYCLWNVVFCATIINRIFFGLTAIVNCGVAIVAFDISTKHVSRYHTNSSTLYHYITVRGLSLITWIMRRKLEKETKDCRKVQDEMLLARLQSNVDTVYGRKHKFNEMSNREDFVRLHPLTNYSHYESYVSRLLLGEENILTTDPPVKFGVTSGTSGKSSTLQLTRKQKSQFSKGLASIHTVMLKSYPVATTHLQKWLHLFYNPKWRKSKAGILIGPASSAPSNSGRLLNLYSTPKVAFDVIEEPKALYLHLLFALRDPDIGMLQANFCSLIYSSFLALDLHWQQIVEDIEFGRVDPKLDIDKSIKDQLNVLLKPDPCRAQEICHAFADGPIGLAKRIWPHCHVILSTNTGTFAIYGKRLEETYCKGIPIYSCIYAATEGLLGVNIWPEIQPARYLLLPASMFYEFILEDRSGEEQPQTLFIDQVEKGGVYELVITNASGVCRYRFGDVIRVVDFHNACPVIEFMYRQGQFLNVHAEKTSEFTFYQALTEAVSAWPHVTLHDYCCAESVLASPVGNQTDVSPYYIVFVELDGDEMAVNINQCYRNTIDKRLCNLSYVYKSFRDKGSIGSMKVYIVQKGGFQELRQFTMEITDVSSNQYKVPRVLRRLEAVQFLMERVLS